MNVTYTGMLMPKMSVLVGDAQSPRDKILALQRSIAELPQVEIQTDHYFADGMYARVVSRKAGVVIVGKVHKREHLYIVTKGCVLVTNGDQEPVIHQAGSVIISRPGTKRAVLSIEDSICMTVHRTDKTDLDDIEEELIEPDLTALFDARNKLKELPMKTLEVTQ